MTLPALIHSPTVVDWTELTQFQNAAEDTGINGTTHTAYRSTNPDTGSQGEAAPLSVRLASPWAGTRAVSFRLGRGFLAAGPSPTGNPIGQGALTLAFLVRPHLRVPGIYSADLATLMRWGRNRYLAGGTVQGKDWCAWEDVADNTQWEVALGNYDAGGGYSGRVLILSHDRGSDPDVLVRTVQRAVRGAPQSGAISHVLITRSDDTNPVWSVVNNGRLSMQSDRAWAGGAMFPVANEPPSDGSEDNSRILLGEAYDGELWSFGILERVVTGLDVSIGDRVTGEAAAIYDSIPWAAAGLPRRAP